MVCFRPIICHGIFNPGTNPMLRLCPDRPLPPYSYVPGRFPHPIRDPSGHSYKAPGIQQETHRPSLTAPVSLASDWKPASDYLFGIDLFNHGFYWEAHETWEQLWLEFGRSGRDANFIKGLIKLAAAGVKARKGVRSVCGDMHVEHTSCFAWYCIRSRTTTKQLALAAWISHHYAKRLMPSRQIR